MPYMPLMCGEERTTSDGKVITTRPATREMFTTNTTEQTKKRVCAYARVSTDNEEQQTSYTAQVDFYTKLIKSNPDYEFIGVFTDEGISATSTAKREGFKKMIAAALDGQIDRILTKSVSRFARNTVDSLTTIRKLKDKGVGVFFEKENIDTLDSKGELLITLMSSLAQEESRSISQNTTWGQRKRFSDGKVTMPFSHFLGYDRGEDGRPVVNEEEAKTVRLIYKLYLDGKSTSTIARYLMRQGVPTPGGCDTWQTTTVNSILTNEKYRGDALLQKSFTVDFLTKKMKKNEGEVQQYYVKNSHPAIVSQEVFDLVQCERNRRQEGHIRICSGSILAGKLFCGECGGLYGSKVWNSNNKYRKVIWQCNNKYGRYGKTTPLSDRQTGLRCTTSHVTEEQVKDAFVRLVNEMLSARGELLAFYDKVISTLTDTSALQTDKDRLEQDAAAIKVSMRAWIAENARRAMSTEVYQKRYDELEGELARVEAKIAKAEQAILLQNARRGHAAKVMKLLRREGLVERFDEELFGGLVDRVIVGREGLTMKLKDGSEREVSM